jgi:hypothetical protein
MPVACVVEGHGEVESLPILVRRLGERCEPPVYPTVERPIRIPSSKLRKPEELARAVQLAASRAGPGGSVLVLLDADDDCPAEVGPTMLEHVGSRKDVAVSVVLANREYEAWFIAAAESVAGARGLAADLTGPDDPESIRGAKEWLRHRMNQGSTYSPTLDQPALTSIFDVDAARRSDSFDKCFREIMRLIGCA